MRVDFSLIKLAHFGQLYFFYSFDYKFLGKFFGNFEVPKLSTFFAIISYKIFFMKATLSPFKSHVSIIQYHHSSRSYNLNKIKRILTELLYLIVEKHVKKNIFYNVASDSLN